jgi:AAA family ATP:ADP antiporter
MMKNKIINNAYQSMVKDIKGILTEVPLKTLLIMSMISALILMSYALARGPSESLFLSYYQKSDLPWLGIVTGIAVFILIAFYNRILESKNLYWVFHGCFFFSGLSLLLLLLVYLLQADPQLLRDGKQAGDYLHIFSIKLPIGLIAWIRVWSDLYIIVLVEIFWTLCNLNLPMKKHPFLYGLFGAVGTLGSMLGNVMVHQLAKPFGTESLLMLVIPILLLMNILAYFLKDSFKVLLKAHRQAQQQKGSEKKCIDDQQENIDVMLSHEAVKEDDHTTKTENKVSHHGLVDGFKLIWKSQYLSWLLLLVLFSQLAINLIDFEFSGILQAAYPNPDDRTKIQGFLYGLVDIGALVLQLSTGFLIYHLRVGGALVSIALLMLGFGMVAFIVPSFFWIANLRVMGKFSTYSLFKTAKEMLYVPLSYEEQTQGKSLIDILIYRQSKIISSLLLLFMTAYHYQQYLLYLLVFTLFAWLLISLKLAQFAKKNQL